MALNTLPSYIHNCAQISAAIEKSAPPPICVKLFRTAACILLTLLLTAPVSAKDKSDGLFVSADIQRYLIMGGLEDYTVPKPGWSAAAGWTFPLGRKNDISAFIQSGHRVISGENPLVRTLDIIPLQIGAEWSFSPVPLFFFGLNAGGGFFYSTISHYETVVALLTEEISTTTGFSPFFAAALHAGISLCDASVQFKAQAGIECISETDGLIPVPAVSFQARVYPVRAVRHARKPPEVVEVERVIEKERVVEKERIVEKELIVEVPVFPELPPFPFDENGVAVIYFNTKEDFMRESVAAALDSVGAYLEAVPELTVVIEGNSAPFDSAKERYSMGLRRAKAVREHLLEHFNIAARRVRTTSAGSSRSGGIVRGAGNEAYTEFRCARILVDADSLAAAHRRLSAERKTEAAEDGDGGKTADGEASASTAKAAATGEESADACDTEATDDAPAGEADADAAADEPSGSLENESADTEAPGASAGKTADGEAGDTGTAEAGSKAQRDRTDTIDFLSGETR